MLDELVHKKSAKLFLTIFFWEENEDKWFRKKKFAKNDFSRTLSWKNFYKYFFMIIRVLTSFEEINIVRRNFNLAIFSNNYIILKNSFLPFSHKIALFWKIQSCHFLSKLPNFEKFNLAIFSQNGFILWNSILAFNLKIIFSKLNFNKDSFSNMTCLSESSPIIFITYPYFNPTWIS